MTVWVELLPEVRSMKTEISSHFGRDRYQDEVTQWVGPLGLRFRRFEIRFWLPRITWVWGYWR